MQLILVIVSAHYLSATIPAFAIVVYILQKVYLRTSRRLRLLELEAKAPLYTHFTETIEGITTIRAFGWEDRFLDRGMGLLDSSQRPFYLLYNVQFWLNLVLNLLVASLAVVLLGMIVALKESTNAGFVGVALSTLMAFNQSLTSLLKYWTLLEISIGAVERVKTFSEVTKLEQDGGEPVPGPWPSSGGINIKSLEASYE